MLWATAAGLIPVAAGARSVPPFGATRAAAAAGATPGPARSSAGRSTRPVPGAGVLGSARPPEDSLPGDVTVRTLAGGARLAFYRQPTRALVAVRITFPLTREEGPPQALARIAQGLARERMEREAAAYGAHVSLERSATHASFAITGAAEDFQELVGVLRRGVAWGDWSASEVRTARLVAATQARQDAETPEPLLRGRLAALLFPELPAAPDSVPPSLTSARLRRFWARSFVPGRMCAVVVGGVTETQAAAALAGWPALAPPETKTATDPESAAPADSAVRAPARAPKPAAGAHGEGPQVLFPWAALGWTTDASPATAAIAARLVQGRLATAALRAAHAELWWTGGRRALVVLGSATASGDSSGSSVSAALSTAVSDVAAAVTPADVAAARLAVARDILFSARTPEGLARFLGELCERTGDPAAGQAFLRSLDRVDGSMVEAMLRAPGEPVEATVLP